MSKKNTIFLVLIISLFFISCSSLQSVLNSAPKPSASISGVQFAGLDLQQANLVFNIDIANPYSLPLPLTNLDYSLATSGSEFLSGKASDLQGSIPANGSKTIDIPVSVNFLETLNVLSSFKPGAVIPYTANMNLSVDAPGVGPLSLPLSKEDKLPVPTVPDVQVQSIDWQDIGFSKATATLKLLVKNNNQFALDMNKLDYALNLAGSPVVQNQISKATSFKEGQQNVIEIPISILPTNLGMAFFNILKGSGASYSIDGNMDFQTPFGPLNLPLAGSGETKFNH